MTCHKHGLRTVLIPAQHRALTNVREVYPSSLSSAEECVAQCISRGVEPFSAMIEKEEGSGKETCRRSTNEGNANRQTSFSSTERCIGHCISRDGPCSVTVEKEEASRRQRDGNAPKKHR